MLKDKKKQKVSDRPLPPLYSAEDIPSQNCKDFLIDVIVRYYEEINLCTLESMYVRYREEGPEMFKHDMHLRMTEHLMAPSGMLITRKGAALSLWMPECTIRFGMPQTSWPSMEENIVLVTMHSKTRS